jgi:tetratricopeptide (TPR) repeat protein
MTGVIIATLAVGLPALGFTLWPLFRRGSARTFLPLPQDEREQLLEGKRAALAALRELEFEHSAGHLSDEDHAELRARYEAEAARVLVALDKLGSRPAAAKGAAGRPAPARRSAWQHPLAASAAGILLVVFGIALGVGIVRYSAPEATPTSPMAGGSAFTPESGPGAEGPSSGRPEGGSAPREITPAMLQGMLGAARTAMEQGQYSQAIAAYQAILKRQPKNTEALTRLGLILSLAAQGDQAGTMLDHALDFYGRALAVDPNYPPALLYRGDALFKKQQVPEAIQSWEKFLSVSPAGEERDRVQKMIAEAKTKGSKAAQ